MRRLIFDERGGIIDLTLIDANPGGLKILGVGSIDEVSGKRFSDIIGREQAAKALELARDMRAAGKPLVDEVHINSIDRYYMVTATLLGEDHIITTSVDITESRRAQIKAEENEALSSALNQINAYINSTLDSNEIMQRVLEEGAKALNAESSLINMRENDSWVARSVHNFPPSILGQLKTEEESPTSMLVMEERKAVAIEDAYEDERVDRRAMRSFGVRSVLVIPIVLKDEIIGIIAFYHHSRKVHFSDAQIDFANKLAGSFLWRSRTLDCSRPSRRAR